MALMIGVGVSVGVLQAAAARQDLTLVAQVEGNVTALTTDGEWLLWAAYEHQSQISHDIFATRLSSGETLSVATGPEDQGGLGIAIDQGVAVWVARPTSWEGTPRIVAREIATGREFTVAEAGYQPEIGGDWVLWWHEEDAPAGWLMTLFARNIKTLDDPIVLAQGIRAAGTSGRDLRPRPFSFFAVSNGQAAWIERPDLSDATLYPTRLVVRDLESGATTIVAEPVNFFTLSGDLAVYVDAHQQVVVQRLSTGEHRVLDSRGDEAAVHRLLTDGRFVVWRGVRPFQGYDMELGRLFPLPDPGFPGRQHLANGVLAWFETMPWSGSAELHAVHLRDTSDGALARYFPETGDWLAFDFLRYWDRRGGLLVFGYPLTPEITENGLRVQYLERQRFEYHPEHRGTPYEVELGLLGTEDAIHRGLFGSGPFEPLRSETVSDKNCQFVPETGHRLCHGFRAYWQAHGLEFGDPGVSFRESLALFGYPISEEFTDPETGLTVQYFERARFEYHPGNPEPYRVLLGRLGADLLARREW